MSTPLALILLVGAAVLGWYVSNRGWIAAPAPPPERTQQLANTETVITAVRDLARLESVSFHMERVIDLKERQQRMWGFVGANEAILLVAAGDVVAGIDLSKLREGDIQVRPTDGTVIVRLPPPEILSVNLDNQRTYVHTHKTDWLAKRTTDLETRARQLAEDSLRNAALEAGILERARRTSSTTLQALLRSLGYGRPDVGWSE